MKRKSILALLLTVTLFVSGCGNAGAGGAVGAGIPDESKTNGQDIGEEKMNDEEKTGGEENRESSAITALNPEDMFSDRDLKGDYDESTSAVIVLNGTSAHCDSDAVEIDGTTVTIKDEGTYMISGTLEDGMIVVNADKDDKTQLVLNGANIHSETCAPIYVLQADKVFVTLADGTENSLSNGGSFSAIDDNEIDGVIFSKEDITLNGGGSLNIDSPAGHGVVSKDELTVAGGAYEIHCGSHGLSGKDSVAIANAKLSIVSGKDGIHAENKDDTSLGYLYIQSSSVEIRAEGDGISAEPFVQIDGGTFNIDSVEDAVHSNGSVVVNDGTFAIATKDDGFHADEKLTVNGGTINISESYEGLEALHVEIHDGRISLVASDDGINAAGGVDSSGFGGPGGNDAFGGRGGFGGKDNFGDKAAFGEKDAFGGKGGAPGGMPGGSSNGSITITGGEIYVKASGDGIDANGSLTMSGGHVMVCGPNRGDTATLDYDTTGTITGGTFIGSGAMGMAQTFSESEQGVIFANVGNVAAGTEVVLKDKSGNILITATPELDFSVVILSSPMITSGEAYTLTVGSQSADFTAQ